MRTLILGSRGSQLAMYQANLIAQKLREMNLTIEIQRIKTQGDKILDVPLAQIGGKGLFTKELEEALLDRRIDLAVHSLEIIMDFVSMRLSFQGDHRLMQDFIDNPLG